MATKSSKVALKHDLRYGGSSAGTEELKAITGSVKKSIKTGNWQAAEEAALMEQEAAEFLGVKHCVLTSSGSCAGLLALQALELPPMSEVIISACTFPTIFNIIFQSGLLPVVVDATPGTYTFDVEKVAKAITPNTRAIIAIHPVGNPVDMPTLMDLVSKQDHKIYVIEDNCDGWGSSIGDKRCGAFGDISITSFHAAHIVSMGVGGGVFTDDSSLAQRVRMYRDWGRQADSQKKNDYPQLPEDYNPRFIYEKMGYNFQILELQAAMGRVQLLKSDDIKALRKANFNYFYEHLSRYPLVMPKSVEGADVCWFAFPLSFEGGRGKLIEHLESRGVETRSMFSGNVIRHPAYANVPYLRARDLSGADYILRNSFWISVHPRLTQEDREYVAKIFDDFFT